MSRKRKQSAHPKICENCGSQVTWIRGTPIDKNGSSLCPKTPGGTSGHCVPMGLLKLFSIGTSQG